VSRSGSFAQTVTWLAMRLFARLEYEQKSCLICGSYFIPVP
jgi:hypothetical protein